MRSRGPIWDLFSKRFRPFCTSKETSNSTNANKKNGTNIVTMDEANVADEASSSSISRRDAYKELENLNFRTAARILFTTPPKHKKFGLDFHLVQLFFVCLPSLAVYLVAQYARSEMRRMDAELEVKKRAEEAKAKEKAAEEQEMTSDPQLLAVKVRLDKLEETVKEIVVESKKKSVDNGQVGHGGRKQPTMVKPNDGAGDASSSSTAKCSPSKEAGEGRKLSTALTDASQDDQKSSKNYKPSSDVKK